MSGNSRGTLVSIFRIERRERGMQIFLREKL